MAASSSHNTSTAVNQMLPLGPIFIDENACECALLQKVETEVWRCTPNTTTNIYSGQTGMWFFAINKTDPASLHDSPNSDRNPPNVTTSYIIEGEGQDAKFVAFNSSETYDDDFCSGVNDTEASSDLYELIPTSIMASTYLCWQPNAIGLVIQNASAWNATGCNLGFLCKCAYYHALRESLQVDADNFICCR